MSAQPDTLQLAQEVEEIRKYLREEFRPYVESLRKRRRLHEIGLERYVPRRSAEEYLAFLNRHPAMIMKLHAQDTRNPTYFTLFTEASQYVYGDTVEECIDIALDRIEGLSRG